MHFLTSSFFPPSNPTKIWIPRKFHCLKKNTRASIEKYYFVYLEMFDTLIPPAKNAFNRDNRFFDKRTATQKKYTKELLRLTQVFSTTMENMV